MIEDLEANTITVMENGELITVDLTTGDVVQSSALPATSRYPYNVAIGQTIATYVREGTTIKKIAGMKGMPSVSVIYAWMGRYPDFKYNIAEARKDRGHYFHDCIVDELDQMDLLSKDEVPAKKLKVDSLKWLADKGNPASYGSKTTIAGDADNPIGIQVINTGIKRIAQEEVLEAEFKEVEGTDD